MTASTTKGLEQAEAFWEQATAATFNSSEGRARQAQAKKALTKLPAELSPATLKKIYAFYLEEAPYELWPATASTLDEHAGALVACLRNDESVQARALVAAYELGGADALREAGAFFAFVTKSTNLPAALKRLPALSPSDALTAAAAKVAIELSSAPEITEIIEFWSLVWVAGKARPDVLDALEKPAAEWDDADVLARVRKAVNAGPPPPPKKPAATVDLPLKVSEVKAWLAAHQPLDEPTLRSLARRPKQKAAEMAAAIRALTQIGTPAALDIIASYRPNIVDGQAELDGHMGDTFADAVAREIIAAWGRFDRRVFAGKIFAGLGTLRIAHGGDIDDLTGISAATGLRDLRMLISPTCDLAPLAACVELTRLELNVAGRTSGLEPLSRIPELSHLAIINGAQLDQAAVDAVAQVAGLERLYLTVGPGVDIHPLTRLPALKRLKLAAGDRKADPRLETVLRDLIRRGVEVNLYTHEAWTGQLSLASTPGVASVVQAGHVAFTNDPSRVEAIRSRLFSSTFLE